MVFLKLRCHFSKKYVLLQFNSLNIMDSHLSSFENLIPHLTKRYLLLVAAIVWTFAGGMLLFRGISILRFYTIPTVLEECGCGIAGIFFYIFMFSAISRKHIQRILNLPMERPGVFLFFNGRSYGMMALMICCGVSLRMSGIVPLEYLSLFYIAMGTPLLLSAMRFYYHAIKAINQFRNKSQPTSTHD